MPSQGKFWPAITWQQIKSLMDMCRLAKVIIFETACLCNEPSMLIAHLLKIHIFYLETLPASLC